jgi:hypothetical protein
MLLNLQKKNYKIIKLRSIFRGKRYKAIYNILKEIQEQYQV